MKVLFVTTDDDVGEAAQTVLGEAGLKVELVDSTGAAEDVLSRGHPDFAVIHEAVEGGSPFDLFNYVLEYHPSVPAVIFASDLDEDEMERRPETVVPYQSDKLELALETLADTIEATETFQQKTLYPEPEDEEERVRVLEQFDFDALEDADFYDELTRKGAELLDVPMCYVGIIDADEERFLSCHGVDFDSIEREQTICSYAIITDDVMVVEDVKDDPRFRDMGAIQALDLEWYASAPIIIDGQRIGTFCIADTEQRDFSDEDKRQLRELADEFAAELEKHRSDAQT